MSEVVATMKEAFQLSTRRVCMALGVSRTHLSKPPSKRRERDKELSRAICEVHRTSHGRYGAPRIHGELQEHGTKVSRKRVARLMQENAISGQKKPKYVATTDSKHDLPVAANVLERRFDAWEKDRVWVGDITYVGAGTRFAYLSILIDLHARRVVGFHLAQTLETTGPLAALAMARRDREPQPGLMIHHDRGCQYASEVYRREVAGMGATLSMSRKGNCWDNAVAESFFATLKTELGSVFPSFEQAEFRIKEYIDWYNTSRRHSFNRGASPIQKEVATYMKIVA